VLGDAFKALGRDLQDPLPLEWALVAALGRRKRLARRHKQSRGRAVSHRLNLPRKLADCASTNRGATAKRSQTLQQSPWNR
jgi:hypothetical protein